MKFHDIPFLQNSGIGGFGPNGPFGVGSIYSGGSGGPSVTKGWWDAFWLSYADNTPIDTTNVWTDLSGNGNHLLQATAAKQPLLRTNIVNGHNIVRFDGGSDVLDFTTAIVLDTLFTIIIVGKLNAAVLSVMLGSATLNKQVTRNGVNNTLGAYFGNVNTSSSPGGGVLATQVQMMVWKRDGSNNISFRVNKQDLTVSGTDAGAFTCNSMGIFFASGSYLNGDICEMAILDNNVFSNSDLDYIYENWFKAKWLLP